MKREDIDKKIGLPDVDEEWARFEREVIGTSVKPSWRRVATWAGGIGIAAAIALLFVLNMGKEEVTEQPLAAQQPSEDYIPVIKEDEHDVIMHVADNSPATLEDALQGRIAGLDDGHLNIRFVSRDSRPAVPLSEHDTILVLVKGKEDRDFLQYLSRMPNDSSVYDYFFSKNQLLVRQTLPSKEEQATLYAPTLFEGRDIRLVVDYQTVPFTPVAQLTADEIKSRRMDYLLKSYRAGFSKNSSKEYYSPDLYDTPVRERLFGLLATEYDKWGRSKDEHFGPVGSDSHGIYVPLVRNVVLKSQDDAWYEDGEVIVLADDPRFNALVDDIRRAATQAESSIVSGDSVVRMAFICGGKVGEGQPHDLMSDMQRPLYQKVKESTFHFLPYEDAPSYWWGEVYYSTTSQRHLWMQLYSFDKLYAADCPELLSNRRHVEGVVMDEKGIPLSGACVNISSSKSLQDGVMTDSNGHFELWLPFSDATIGVNCIGYRYHIVQPADTVLTVRMQDATQLKNVKVRPKLPRE